MATPDYSDKTRRILYGDQARQANWRASIRPNEIGISTVNRNTSKQLLERVDGWVYAMLNIIASSISKIPLRPYQVDSQNNETPIQSRYHPYSTLLKRINRRMGLRQWLYLTSFSMEATGNSFSQLVFENPNHPIYENAAIPFPVDMYHLESQHIDIITDANDEQKLGYFYDRSRTQGIFLPREQILHCMFPAIEGSPWLGVPPLQSGRIQADLSQKIWWHKTISVDKGISPSFLVAIEELGEDEREQVLEVLNRDLAGPENAGTIAVLRGKGVKIHNLGPMPKVEVAFQESNKEARSFLAALLQIPEQIITVEDVNRANSRTGTPMFADLCLTPRLCWIEDAMNEMLSPIFSEALEQELVVRFDPVLLEDENAKVQKHQTIWASNGYRYNEYRAAIGMPPLDGPEGEMFYNELVAFTTARATSAPVVVGQPPVIGSDTPGSLLVDSRRDDGRDEAERVRPDPPLLESPKPGAAEGGEPEKTEETVSSDAKEAEAVAAGLNGAQIASVERLLQTVTDGLQAPDVVALLVSESFPAMDTAKIQRMVDGAAAFGKRGRRDENLKTLDRDSSNDPTLNDRLSERLDAVEMPADLKEMLKTFLAMCKHEQIIVPQLTNAGTATVNEIPTGQTKVIETPDNEVSLRALFRGEITDCCLSDGKPPGTKAAGDLNDFSDKEIRLAAEIQKWFSNDIAAKVAQTITEKGISYKVLEDEKAREKLLEILQEPLSEAYAKGFEQGVSDIPDGAREATRAFRQQAAQAFLQDRANMLIQSVDDLVKDNLGRALAEVIDAGGNLGDATKAVQATLGDISAQRAELISHTEMSRSFHESREQAWQRSGLEGKKGVLLSSHPCEVCKAVQARGLLPIGQPFIADGETISAGERNYKNNTGGGLNTPLHPGCNCSMVVTWAHEEVEE